MVVVKNNRMVRMLAKLVPERRPGLVLKFGGSSATNMEGANFEYLRWFFASLNLDLAALFARAALVIGGGPRIRELQKKGKSDYDKDMIAREALWQHAAQLGQVATEQGLTCLPRVPRSTPEAIALMETQREFALALSWLQAGQSTDTAAIVAAEVWRQRFREALVVILSNVAAIYTADPKLDHQAQPIRVSSINLLVAQGVLQNSPDQFKPGMSVTIDPVAVQHLQQMGRQAPAVFFGHAEDIAGVREFLLRRPLQSGTYLDPHMPATQYYERT